jgi:uncharacterized membrane protein
MELSPEERKRIYEEEKARIEAREQIEQERWETTQETSVGLSPNVAGWLCYLGVWISGIIFFVLEQKNKWVRFHAAQSIIVFGTLAVAGAILGWIPVIGPVFSSILGIIGFILWIILQIKAYKGERYKVAWAGDIAERMVASSGTYPDYRKTPEATAPPQPAGTATEDIDAKIHRKVEEFFHRKRGGRITASAFAIAWSIVLLVFFNFFYEYVAYYHASTAGGVITWTRQSFFTSEIYLWLPVLTIALVVSIAGHIVLIVFDRYILRQIILLILDVFGLATVATLLAVFPFDFTVIPDTAAAAATQVGVTVVLICIAVGFGIGLLVRAVKLIINILKGTADFRQAA